LQDTVADLGRQIKQTNETNMMDPIIASNIDNLNTRAASLQIAAETLKEKQETNVITSEEFNIQLQTLKDQNQELQGSANELREQLIKQTNRTSKAVDRFRRMTQRCNEQNAELGRLIKLEKKIIHKAETLEDTVETLENTIERQRKELMVYGELAAHRATTIAEMESINQNIIDKIRQMSGNLERINIGNAAAGLALIEDRIHKLETDIVKLKTKLDDCDEKLKQCNAELGTCNRHLDVSKDLIENKNKEIETLKVQLALTQQQMQECETKKQNLIAENNQLTLQLNKAKEDYDARIKEANDAWDKEGKALRQQLIDIHNYLLGKEDLPPSNPTKLEESSVLQNIYKEIESTFDDYDEKIIQLERQIEELKRNNGASPPPSIVESPSIDQSDIVTAYSLSSFKTDQSKLVTFDLGARFIIDNYTDTINDIQNKFNIVDKKYILEVKNAKKNAQKAIFATELADPLAATEPLSASKLKLSDTKGVASTKADVASLNPPIVLDPSTCFTEFIIDNVTLKAVLKKNSLLYNWREKIDIFGILGDLSISKLVELTTLVCGVICKDISLALNPKDKLTIFAKKFDALYNNAFGPDNKNRGNLSSVACVTLLDEVVGSIFNLKKWQNQF